jgi:hypothetical protein
MKMKKRVAILALFINIALSGLVKADNTAVAPSESAGSTTSALFPSVKAPLLGPFKVTAGFKSFDATGRPQESGFQNGRTSRMRNEFYAGLIHESGWGLSVMGVQYGETYKDNNKSNYGAIDPSVTLIHPKIYDDGTLKLFGQLRRYFPASAFTLSRHQEQYAYYLFATYKMPRAVDMFNQLTPRYFAQDFYKPSDSVYFVEDYTTITKKINSWFKYGIGQHTQVEWHESTSPGRVVELYPLVDFVMNDNMFFEPRVFIPIYKTNEVWDSPRAVSLDSTMFELFWQASI